MWKRRYKRSLPIMGMPTPTACTVDPNPHPCIAELFSMLPTPVSQHYRTLLATHLHIHRLRLAKFGKLLNNTNFSTKWNIRYISVILEFPTLNIFPIGSKLPLPSWTVVICIFCYFFRKLFITKLHLNGSFERLLFDQKLSIQGTEFHSTYM